MGGDEVAKSYNDVLENVNTFLSTLVISAIKSGEQMEDTIKQLVNEVRKNITFKGNKMVTAERNDRIMVEFSEKNERQLPEQRAPVETNTIVANNDMQTANDETEENTRVSSKEYFNETIENEEFLYSKISEPDAEGSDGISFSCAKCHYVSKWKNSLKRHYNIVHLKILKETDPVACDQCSYTAFRKPHLIRHIKNVHNNIKEYN